MPALYCLHNNSNSFENASLIPEVQNLMDKQIIPEVQSQTHLEEHKISRFKVQTVDTNANIGITNSLSTSTQQINTLNMNPNNLILPNTVACSLSLPPTISSTANLNPVETTQQQQPNQNFSSLVINNNDFGSSTLEQLNRELRKVSGVVRSTDSQQQGAVIVRSSSVARAPSILEQQIVGTATTTPSLCVAPLHTSLPHTPSGILTTSTGDVVQQHNLAELNEKLQALSLKQQSLLPNEQPIITDYSEHQTTNALEEVHRAASVATMLNTIYGNFNNGQHLSQVAPTVSQPSTNIIRAHSVAPHQMQHMIDESGSSFIQTQPLIYQSHVNTMPQVDTLNELASALQKVFFNLFFISQIFFLKKSFILKFRSLNRIFAKFLFHHLLI